MHLDDHTLELYVLGAKSIDDKRSEIEAHLHACEHCRAYVAKVDGFYSQLDENIGKEFSPNPKPALVRRRSDELAPLFYNDAPPVPYRPTTRMEKFRYFARRHPIATGSGAFVVLAGLAMMANVATKPVTVVGPNPTSYHYNVEKGLIEIRNAASQDLWQLTTKDILSDRQASEKDTKSVMTIVKDLEGDGTNEILTILPVDEEKEYDQLKIYESDGRLRFRSSFPEEFKYSTRNYSQNIAIANLLVSDIVEKGKQEIWLNASSFGRSPSMTIRLDAKGNVLGKYWHFGNFRAMYDLDVDNDGKMEIVMTGINDLNEESYHQYPTIVILDPHNVVGNRKSSTAPEYAFPVTAAEIYYIKLPLTDLNRFYRLNASVQKVSDINENAIQFEVPSAVPENRDGFAFNYFFGGDMRIREVKSGNTTIRLHDQLVAEGKLTGKIDSAYLENLKSSVRYWDGKEWQKEVVRVRPAGTVAAM